MHRRAFLSGVAQSGVAVAVGAPATTQRRQQDDFGDWMQQQLDLAPLPGEPQQVRALLAALRFRADIDPRVEPAIRFEPL